MTSPTRIVLDTAVLSHIVDTILDALDAPRTKKSTCLNLVAAAIAGPKHNWGFLTGHKGQVVARGTAPLAPSDVSGKKDLETTFLDEFNALDSVLRSTMVESVRQGMLERRTDVLQTPRSWEQASALIANLPVAPVDMATFIAFLRKTPNVDASFIAWVGDHKDVVDRHIDAGKSTYRDWHNAGVLLDHLNNAQDTNTISPSVLLSMVRQSLGNLADTVIAAIKST